MENNIGRSSYRSIFKATSVFGGVQVFSILINLFKSKVIALFLGPEGLGIFNLLQTPINLLTLLFGLGIPTSGIREVAKNEEIDVEGISKNVLIVKRWTRITGLIGMTITFCAAPYISLWSFGNYNYSWALRILSIVIFITALGSENDVILKGRRRIKDIAKAGVYSAGSSFLLSIPFYYFFGINGVVLVIIATSVFIFIFNLHFAKKIVIDKTIKVSVKETFSSGKKMALLGIYIVLGDLIYTSAIFLVNMFIRSNGSISDVGLFQAAMQITNSSIGLVFAAMAGDFYPRLVAIRNNWNEISSIASKQAEIAVLLCTPIIAGMIVFSPLLINVFFSKSFIQVNDIVIWTLFATVFKASTWTIVYVLLARGATKLYLLMVVINNIMLLPFYCTGYYFYGISGIGIGYVILMFLYCIIQYWIVKSKLQFHFTSDFIKLLLVSILLCFISLVSGLYLEGVSRYLIGISVLFITICYSFFYLDKKINILSYLKYKILKK